MSETSDLHESAVDQSSLEAVLRQVVEALAEIERPDRKSTRLNSSH